MNAFDASKYADLKITVVPFASAAASARNDPFGRREMFENGAAGPEPEDHPPDATELTWQAREHLERGEIVEALMRALMASLTSGPDAGNVPLVGECLERLGLGQMARQLEELAARAAAEPDKLAQRHLASRET